MRVPPLVTTNSAGAGSFTTPLVETKFHCSGGAGSGCFVVISVTSRRFGVRIRNWWAPGRGSVGGIESSMINSCPKVARVQTAATKRQPAHLDRIASTSKEFLTSPCNYSGVKPHVAKRRPKGTLESQTAGGDVNPASQ